MLRVFRALLGLGAGKKTIRKANRFPRNGKLNFDTLEDRLAPAGITLFPDDTGPQEAAEFGFATAADSDFQIVGVPNAAIDGVGAGVAYVYSATTGALVATLANPTPAMGDFFGFSVAVSGSTVVVGAFLDDAGAGDSGQAYVFDAATGALLQTLANPTPAISNAFGFSVAVSGNTVVVGAPGDNTGAGDSGQAYVFNALTGALLQTLANPTPAVGDSFGLSVAVSGSTVVVGTRYDDTSASNSGQAYVFDATTGALLQTLANPTPAAGDQFGFSVAVSGSTVVVGAPFDNTSAGASGQAYVFNALTGALLKTLDNPTPAVNDSFGSSVAVSGSTLVVGAFADNTGGSASGQAYVFDATTGALLKTLANPTPGIDDQFGFAVAVSGNEVVVGARGDDSAVRDSGQTYVFDATTGALLRALANPTPAVGDHFGSSMAVSGKTVVGGVPNDDTGAPESGQAYVFDALTGALLQTLANPTPAVNDNFGFSVAVSGSTVVVGAHLDDTGATDSGQVYVFDATTGALLKTLANPTPRPNDQFGSSVAVSGNKVVVAARVSGQAYVFDATTGALLKTLAPTPGGALAVAVSGSTVVVGAPFNNTGASASGQAYVFDATTGALLKTLANPTPATFDLFGYSVAVSGNTVVVGAFDDTGASDSGQAYVFDATSGALLKTLANPTPAADDLFGINVAVSGNTVVVGAQFDDTGASNSGQAYVFDATTGALLKTLANPTPEGFDQFGVSVAVAGKTVVVGSLYDNTQNPDQGAAYVFDLNHAPLITVATTDDSGSVTEEDATPNLTTSGAIHYTDADTADTHTASFTPQTSGYLGTFSLDTSNIDTGNGGTVGWSFTAPNAAVQFLAEGETQTQKYDVIIDDGAGTATQTVTRTVTITITGTNDAPAITVATTDDSSAVTEDDSAPNLTTLGAINYTDADTADTHTADFTPRTSGYFGTFSLDTTAIDTGNGGTVGWSFTVPNAAVQFLAEGQTLIQKYDVTVDDGTGTVTRTVTLTIAGTNDAPAITVATTDHTSAVTEDAATPNLTTSGAINYTDVDTADTHTADFTPQTSGYLGTFSLNTTNIDTSNGGAVGWSFTVPNAAVQFLAEGETRTQKYDVTIDDGAGTKGQTVTITITGTNDAPAITVATTHASGSVIEDAATPDLTTSGAINYIDADTADTHAADVTPQASGYLGTFSLDATDIDTGNGGTVGWSFTVPNAAVQFLAEGQTRTQKYDVTIDDNTGTKAQTVTITITGTNDAPDITVGAGDSASTGLTESNSPLSSGGTLSVTDLDVTNTVSAAVASVSTAGSNGSSAAFPANAVLKAMMSVEAGDVIDNTHTAGAIHWSFASTPEAFNFLAAGQTLVLTYTLTATDSNTPTAATDTQTVTITITGANDASTLTAFAAPVDTTNQSVAVELTFAELAAQGNEADVDGTVTAFVVQEVSTGTLRIGTSAAAATPFAPGANDTIDATRQAYWTPAIGAKGPAVNAFTVVAKDNGGALSTGAVQVRVNVNEVSAVYFDCGANGFWRWTNVGGFKLIHPADVESFSVSSAGFVYIDFGVYGLWRWAEAAGFQQIHAANPDNVVAGPDGSAYIDFGGNGFWRWSQATGFFHIHPANVESYSIGTDGFVYIDFGSFGLYRWSQPTGYFKIHSANADSIHAGADGFLYIDFGVSGLYRWSQATGFQFIHGANVDGFTLGSDGFLTIDFGGFGLYRWSQATSFVKIHAANVDEVAAGNGFVFVDFGSAGLWRWSQATGFLQIHPVSPQRIRA